LVALKFKLMKDDNPLNTVLLQELQRYNSLLSLIEIDLKALDRGVQGMSVITEYLEKIMRNLLDNRVPDVWSIFYFSLKSLSRWTEDLNERMDFFTHWCQRPPYVYNLNAFTYPNGFSTALLQRFSRRSFGANIVSIDRLEFDFGIVNRAICDIQDYAKDGAFVTGLILEGAKWNNDKGYLMEPEVMELYIKMPVLHFKPIPRRTKALPNMYGCPVYYYPVRQGTVDRDSYIMKIDLKSGEQHPNFWIKRGTALLLSTAN